MKDKEVKKRLRFGNESRARVKFPIKQELDEQLAATLDYLLSAARSAETTVATDWAFQDVLLFVESHGAGKQWRTLYTPLAC